MLTLTHPSSLLFSSGSGNWSRCAQRVLAVKAKKGDAVLWFNTKVGQRVCGRRLLPLIFPRWLVAALFLQGTGYLRRFTHDLNGQNILHVAAAPSALPQPPCRYR